MKKRIDKIDCARNSSALLKYLEELDTKEVSRMRGKMQSRGARMEESRDWRQHEPANPVSGMIRTHGGYIYR